MISTEVQDRNTQMAIDVFIRWMDLKSAERKYRVSFSTLRTVLMHMAYCTLGRDYRSLEQIRELVSQRLMCECLFDSAAPLDGVQKSGTG